MKSITNYRQQSTAYCRLPAARLTTAHCRLPAARCRAFTLIELLVVLTIIAILLAMLIPAVLGARARARIAQCAANQQELAKAMIQYDLNKGNFPGYANKVPGYDAEAGWTVAILKLVDHADIWDMFRRGTAADTRIGLFVCPSDTEAAGTGPALSYAGNCGQPDGGDETATVDGQTEHLGIPDDKVPPDWAANGLLFRHYTADASAPSHWVKVKVTATDIKDGTGYTFLISECYGESLSGMPTSGGVQREATWNGSPAVESLLGFTWTQTPQPSAGGGLAHINWAVNSSVPMMSGGDPPQEVWLPTCNHPGGANVAYADGHTKFLSEDVRYQVYALQMTPNGAEVWAPGEVKGKFEDLPDWLKEPLPSE